MTLIEHLASIIKVSDELSDELMKLTKPREVKKGTIIINDGERSTDLFFIESGLLRGFYYADDREITNWFAQEGEFATCFYSFITNVPAQENVEALEDCLVIQIPHFNLQQLYGRYPETERIGRILTEAYYVKLEGRLLGLQFTSAKERYDKLMDTNPALIQRASLGQIASYLGITQETLSRIRAKR